MVSIKTFVVWAFVAMVYTTRFLFSVEISAILSALLAAFFGASMVYYQKISGLSERS